MRFQNRDAQILLKIYENDGVLARRHIKNTFWPDKTTRAMEVRLLKLQRNDYLSWPTQEHQKTQPIPEPICYLGWRGAQFIAGLYGVRVDNIHGNSENQARLFQKTLRDNGIRWIREPRWSLLRHDLAIVDFRNAIESSADELPTIHPDNWISESEFRSNMDIVEYKVRHQNGEMKTLKRGVCPDAYFEIVKDNRFKIRCLLEMDMATHSNPSFGRDKVRPYTVYINSTKYKSRFGENEGIWLVVTSGKETRLQNLMRQTKEKTGDNSKRFLFAMMKQLADCNVFTFPMWHKVDNNKPMPLLSLTY